MAMSTASGGGVKAEPNVTPMIDVMLVLLIIFMIVIPAINAGFNAQPPQGINLKPRPARLGSPRRHRNETLNGQRLRRRR